MSLYPIEKEDRQRGSSFSGSGFLFLRHYPMVSVDFPYEIPLHQHEWHEFIFNHCPESSEKNRLFLNDKEYPYGHHSLLSIPPYYPHRFTVTSALGIWIIGVDTGQLRRLFAHSPLENPLNKMTRSWMQLPVCSDLTQSTEMSKWIKPIQEFISSNPGTGTLESLESIHFLVEWDNIISGLKLETKPEESPEESSAAMVNRAISYMENHYHEPLGVAQCAAYLGVSRSTLSHQFKNYCGKSIPQWLTEIRIRNARALLLETDLDILSIALECGFNDAGWFSRQFSSLMGIAPSRWREMHKPS